MPTDPTTRDCQLVILCAHARVDLTFVTGFQSRQITKTIKVDRIDGQQLSGDISIGWEGSFCVDRGSIPAAEFLDALEDQVQMGGTMYQYVWEADGSISTYQYDRVMLKACALSLPQRVEFAAQERNRL